jgi:hypothetical protein
MAKNFLGPVRSVATPGPVRFWFDFFRLVRSGTVRSDVHVWFHRRLKLSLKFKSYQSRIFRFLFDRPGKRSYRPIKPETGNAIFGRKWHIFRTGNGIFGRNMTGNGIFQKFQENYSKRQFPIYSEEKLVR